MYQFEIITAEEFKKLSSEESCWRDKQNEVENVRPLSFYVTSAIQKQA